MGFYGAEVQAGKITWIEASPEAPIHLTNACLMNGAKNESARVVLQICSPPDETNPYSSITAALGVLKSSSVENVQLDVLVNSLMGIALAGKDSAGAVVHVVGTEYEMPPGHHHDEDSDNDPDIDIAADMSEMLQGMEVDYDVIFDRDGGTVPTMEVIEELVDEMAPCTREPVEEKKTKALVVKKKGPGLPLITHKSGVKFQDIIIGSGKKVQLGHKLTVQYSLRLENGKVVDRADRKRPFKFRLGIGECVKGFDIGVMGMREGGERHIIIPPKLGYGNDPTPGIPRASTLYFDVTVLKTF